MSESLSSLFTKEHTWANHSHSFAHKKRAFRSKNWWASSQPCKMCQVSTGRIHVVSLHTHICGVRHTFSYKWETYTVVEMWQICCWNDTRLYKEYVVAYTGHITVRSRLKCLRNVALYLNMLRGPPTIFCQQYCTVQFTVQFTLFNQKMCTFLRKLV